jgi:signal transduction histidine kinase/ABC-type amino acid transport substrate-binding protein/ActR/RegA family two-component response regulator
MAREYDRTVDGPEDLAGQTVALVKDYSSSEKTLAEYPTIKPYMVDTPIEGLSAVSVGEADYYVGVLGVNDFLLRKYGISNLKVAARYDMLFSGQRFGVRKDWPILATILNKALDAIPEKKKIAISNTWISKTTELTGSAALQQQNALTEEETEWIQNHPLIRFGFDPEFAPFEYMSKNGAYSGVAADYIHILNCRLGLNMQVVSGYSWTEAVEKAKQHELDVLPCVAITDERKTFFEFSNPYLNFHRVIITRLDTPLLSSLEDIGGLKVAIQANSSHEGFLKDHSNIHPILFPTLKAALRAVSDGQADALIGNIASATYWIRNQNLTNLKVAAPVSNELQKLHFAVRKDWPILVSIINKGLASIGLSKEKQIRNRWIEIEYNPGMSLMLLRKYIVRTAGVILLVLVVFLGWNYNLKREIRKRRQVETNLNYRLDFETLLFEMSSLFVSLTIKEIDGQISKALKRIANFVNADSSFVFRISDHGEKYLNTHGWSAEHLEKMDIFRELDASSMSWWGDRLKRNKVITVPSVKALPDEAETEKQLILATGIRSFVIIPMSVGGEITGFMGGSSVQDGREWKEDEVAVLQAMGQIFTNALQRKQTEEALRRSNEDLEKRVVERTADLAKANENLQQEINDRKQMEIEKEKLTKQLIQAQKMEAIGTMAGGIAHDFNNILMPIMGYAEMTKQSMSPGTQNWDFLEQIVDASKRAKDLVGQILTFSRKTDDEYRPIKLTPLIKETLKLIRSSLPSSIAIREDIEASEGDIMGSPTQIHQLLMNLCTNAYHAMRKNGGTLSVSIDETILRQEDVTPRFNLKSGRYIRLRVNDTGHGIDPGIRDRILEPYFTTKNANEGTGLGLAVVHGIVQKHKGHLAFYSELNQGTTVQVLFPNITVAVKDEIKETDAELTGGTECIWVLDDDQTIAHMEKRMLESLGYKVRAFIHCSQFIEEYKKNVHEVDLVITDMTMPTLTGTQVAREVMELRPEIPIILCSGFNEDMDESKAKAVGIRAYLMKPIIMKELADTVRKVLNRRPEKLASP